MWAGDLVFKYSISIHAPRAGGDITPYKPAPPVDVFQSTPPVRGATANFAADGLRFCISIHAPRAGGDVGPQLCHALHQHFNPRPPCGGRPGRRDILRRRRQISIHAPRAGGDFLCGTFHSSLCMISIHAPRAGGDYGGEPDQGDCLEFQSTPPVRGATQNGVMCADDIRISIHAPRAGGDS